MDAWNCLELFMEALSRELLICTTGPSYLQVNANIMHLAVKKKMIILLDTPQFQKHAA